MVVIVVMEGDIFGCQRFFVSIGSKVNSNTNAIVLVFKSNDI
jgi:hypothetical protein